ncbi:PAS domain-containing protein [Granulosicoccus antarcticus]|uniref:Aerotaxis receptor n=1 Tax=Granulosicoccus antarcticus IMCC3135 TaxID=1192854 RepID=A0A2Z2NZ86_9GAMM|nr:PAS domain-containing protein [Granulosicoccus antarcticus]ASJ76603.1 Aerotaxis receptor [Granulosicoccus antarcticus IMCC3135]
MDRNVVLTGNEKCLDQDDIIVSKTDTSGKLTYGNRTFFSFAGLSESECMGKQHNIIRHPEMPRCVFELLWRALKNGEELFTYINNLSSNGDNYWVLAHVTPSTNSSGQTIGYHSNRRAPNRESLNSHIIPLYNELLKVERSHSSPREALSESSKRIDSILQDKKMGFNEFMFSLGV